MSINEVYNKTGNATNELSLEQKRRVLEQVASIDEDKRGLYIREHGLFQSDIDTWKIEVCVAEQVQQVLKDAENRHQEELGSQKAAYEKKLQEASEANALLQQELAQCKTAFNNNPHVELGFRVLYCMNRTDDQKDQANGLKPRFSIPKHHMYAIWFFATLALLIAIILPTPGDLTNVDAPNATETIDAESIPEQELTNPNEAELAPEEPKSPEEVKAQMFSDAEWQSIEISKGDNAIDIFNNLNLDFEALKAITEVPKYGDSIKKLALGEKLSFFVSAQGKLLVLIKPISKTEQIRYTIVDPLGPYKFNAIVESLDAHLMPDNIEPNVPKNIVSDKTTDDLGSVQNPVEFDY